MPHVFPLTVAYGDTGSDGGLRLDALANMLQAAAIDHATRVGRGEAALAKIGAMWVLHRLSAVLEARPRYGDSIELLTWPTGLSGVRAFREFELCIAGAVIGRAASSWVFFDAARRVPRRLPADVVAAFPVEATRGAFDGTAHDGEFADANTDPNASRCEISLRASDFDTNAHVNNAAYLVFALTALHVQRADTPAPRGFAMAFLREIPPGVRAVEVALADTEDDARFSVSAEGVERARGRLMF